MKAICRQECTDASARKYFRNDIAEIDPKSPVAKYFAFPPGTEKYSKGKNSEGVLVEGLVKEGVDDLSLAAADLNRADVLRAEAEAKAKAEAEAKAKAAAAKK